MLAATLARDGVRPASFLPAIKCSTCGNEIEISAMADHICTEEDAASPPKSRIPHMSNPFTLRQYGAANKPVPPLPSDQQQWEEPAQIPTHRRAPTLNKKPSRIALPKINATAANLSYSNPRQNGMDTPMTPGVSGGKHAYLRSATSPMPRLFDPRPPSPELSANLDCAFPPFPPSGPSGNNTLRRPSTSQGRRTPGSDRAQSRSDSRSASRTENHNLTVEDPYSYEPKSPRTNGGESVLQRLNTLKSGPFAARRQGSAESKEGSSVAERRPSAADVHVRPSAADSNQSHSSQPATSTSGVGQKETSRIPKKVAPQRPSRPIEEQLSPAFLDQFSAEPSELSSAQLPDTRNADVALRDAATDGQSQQALTKQRSEPALRSSSLRRPSLANMPASALPLPPRSQSRNAARVDYRLQDAPPVPKPVLQHRQKASMHTPSESDASTVSTAQSSNYTDHTNSTRPSPAGSVETFSPLSAALSRSDYDEQLRPAGLNVRIQQKPGERAELPRQASPPRSYARPARAAATPAKRHDFYDLESPMDPIMLPRRGAPNHEPWAPSQDTVPSTSPANKQTAADNVERQRALPPPALIVPRATSPSERSSPSTSSTNYTYANSAVSEVSSVPRAPQAPEQLQGQPQKVRRPTNGHKPICRGCNETIEGKSVKAADGRLTGRWHKACFVCRSCEAPFLTADFYVIDNQPYCEHHYHEQNGSLCHGCNHGIEGQYLETTSSTRHGVVEKKYHPRCFTCSQCRMVLKDDYFEISSRIYCERHALAAMRVQARAAGIPGLYPTDQRTVMAERRTTRLINPMVA